MSRKKRLKRVDLVGCNLVSGGLYTAYNFDCRIINRHFSIYKTLCLELNEIFYDLTEHIEEIIWDE
jgi:hypothetical protein